MSNVRFYTGDFLAKLDKEVKLRMQRTLHRLMRIIQELIRQPKTGRIYRVPGTKNKRYRASAPGEAAASRLGMFRKSIRYEVVRLRVAEYEGRVGSSIKSPPYPFFLEYGTKYMDARPTFTLALAKLREEIAREWLMGSGQK